jgi:hypothetical protein
MSRTAVSVAALVLGGITSSYADECWIASNVKGYSAVSNQDYAFVEDGLSQPLLICFSPDGGTVTGSDVRLVKFGDSTLAGYAGNEQGNEVFVVYQIDRERQKLLFTLSRVGTNTVVPLLPDVVRAFVGDAVQAPQ